MDEFEEDSAVPQLRGDQQVGEQQPSDRPVLPTGSQDEMEDQGKPTQGRGQDSGEEWDTDLEKDDATNKRQNLSRAELYLRACQRTGAVPVSSFLRHLGEATLNLNHYGVGPRGAKALATALQNDSDVTNLELEDNALRAQGTRYLMEMLQTNMSIQCLNLSNNQLHLEGAAVVSKMLCDNYYIKSIKLAGNYLDDSAAKYFADALKGDYVVKVLDLSDNKFSDTGGEHLGHMLATNVGIEVLNLSWNQIGKRGAVALSAGLKVNSTLKELQLSWNSFGKNEAESLGQALKQNSTLVLLDLSSNIIDDQAVALLCQGLATNDTLRVLKLSHNPMTDIGAVTLLKTVKKNTKSALEEIDISTVFVYEAFVELLEEVSQMRPAMDVRYRVLSFVTRNLSALQIFQKALEERNESIMDFFQALDKEGTMKVSTSAFRNAVKTANIPLSQRQLDWLIRKFDRTCTASIIYSQLAELS
ncbi:leucine-rich repeat-containing protein 74A-like [Toxotes jaculatrix]|uniref:leucine-rich repeat-containing protein 74A-like n=1 Tax=Toxotes jaculatrix TaxID=941984 RepID=UPI001B3AF7CF|nr:leucine-rich repeat-containing protein 74A-like [Toxotes jaculatrix]